MASGTVVLVKNVEEILKGVKELVDKVSKLEDSLEKNMTINTEALVKLSEDLSKTEKSIRTIAYEKTTRNTVKKQSQVKTEKHKSQIVFDKLLVDPSCFDKYLIELDKLKDVEEYKTSDKFTSMPQTEQSKQLAGFILECLSIAHGKYKQLIKPIEDEIANEFKS